MDGDNIINSLFGGLDGVWDSISRQATQCGIEVTKIMLELYYVLKSESTNPVDKILIGAALAYQLLPSDAFPREKFKWLGFLDNGLTIAFAYNKVRNCITPEIENQVNATLSQWFEISFDSLPSYQSGQGQSGMTPNNVQPPYYQRGNQSGNQNDGHQAPAYRPLSDDDVIID